MRRTEGGEVSSEDEPSMAEDLAPRPAGRNRRRRMLDARALENAALHYVERYASSAENLRRVLQRKLKRAVEDGRAKIGADAVDALVERFRAAGLVDDAVYAEGRVASLARQGASRRAIAQRLAAKGVERDT